MRRRRFMTLMGGAAMALPIAAAGQQMQMRTIGWLSPRSSDTETESSILTAFREGLAQTGYVEGRNAAIEYRYGGGQYERLAALADDLVRRQVAVIVTSAGLQAAQAAKSATS